MSEKNGSGDAEVCLDVADLADLPGIDDLLHPGEERVIAVVKGLDEPVAGSLRRLAHPLGLDGIRGEGFLAEHVLSRLQRADRPLAVQAVRERIVDRVDRRIVEQRLIARVGLVEAVLDLKPSGALRLAGGDPVDLSVGDVPRRANQGHRRDAGGSENADA
jgi:hypothetical protein